MPLLASKPFSSGKMPDILSLFTRLLGISERKNECDTINNPYVQQLFNASPAWVLCSVVEDTGRSGTGLQLDWSRANNESLQVVKCLD